MAIFGAYLPGGTQTADAIEAAIGRRLDVGYLGAPWYNGGLQPFPRAACEALRARGIVPFLHHQPWNLQNQLGDAEWRIPRIIARLTGGDLETYLRQWARDLKAYGGPVVYRPFCEFNARSPQYNTSYQNPAVGATAAQFVTLFRRIVDILRAEGVTQAQARVAWNPNYFYAGDVNNSVDPSPAYPGNDYADLLGMDGYPGNGEGPDSVFRALLPVLRRLGPGKPVWVMETNSWQADKDAYAAKLMAYVETEKIDGLLWFNQGYGNNPTIEGNPGVASAIKKALARPYWQATAPTPVPVPTPTPTPAPSLPEVVTQTSVTMLDAAAVKAALAALDARLRKAGW